MAVTINGGTPSAKQKQDLAAAFDLARLSLDPTTGSVVGLVGPDGGVVGLTGLPASMQIDFAVNAAFGLRALTSAPTVDETSPTITVGNRYYIDPIAGNDGNAGTSPTTAWANLTKLVALNPGANAIIHLAADGVFEYVQTLANYRASPSFPYNGSDNLNGTAGSPVTIRPYYPRGATSSKPIVRFYAQTSASDWTQEAGYGGNVWSASFVKAGNAYYKTWLAYGPGDTIMAANGHNSNGPATLNGVGQYAVDANKLYVYSPDGVNPITRYGSIKVCGANPVFATAWNGLRYVRIIGVQFELCSAVGIDFAANAATVHGGIEIAYCNVIKGSLAVIRNQQIHATPQEIPVSVHHNYLEDVVGAAVKLEPTTGTTGNTMSWEFYLNHVNRANLNSGFGAPLYVQCKSGTKRIAWGNYIKEAYNGRGGTNIDGSALYADVSTNGAVFIGNVIERCGVAIQTNSALGCLVASNLFVDCWKGVQTTGTGTDNTPNMGCNVVHNTWLWTGRIQKSDLELAPGTSSNTTPVFTQWNDQNASGRKYANYSFLNNAIVNAGATLLDRPAHYYVSAGITTLTIAGNAVLGLGSVAMKDDTTDTTRNAEYITLLGSVGGAGSWMASPATGVAKPAKASPLIGYGFPLSVSYKDIAGRAFAAAPTIGCYEANA